MVMIMISTRSYLSDIFGRTEVFSLVTADEISSATPVFTLPCVVHENLPPEDMIDFGHESVGNVHLIVFQQVRSADGMTYYRGDSDWHKNLHRHRSMQGSHPEVA